ncbi:box C/D snoRNA protein 1 [Diorhabda carinulata]|uniref:box C/D snoRNA protein 1 n=1 Tax=Diorhabda carinulata TaxID=1163345 RepID=UPI0025A0B418|nr:box C/D snoRNA protein 1 [Diorhabda carinulata]
MDVGTTESQDSEVSAGSETFSSKLGLCEVCTIRNGKYTCPRCEVKTCSLKCNRIHKLELECNGDRDRTKFVPLNKFSNLDLVSDYRLLEEISRSLEAAKKNFRTKWNLQRALIKLKYEAKLRKVDLKFLPSQFTRRKNNTTNFQSATAQIFWHVEWIFVNADNLRLYDENVPETQKLGGILQKYFMPDNDKLLAEKLQYYQAVGIPGVKLFLKAEQRTIKKFYELDSSMTLKESLANKLIIEYPTIHVVFKDHGCGYDVIDSDDDEEDSATNEKSGKEVINNIINRSENEEINRSSKNLLFVSEYSDDGDDQ